MPTCAGLGLAWPHGENLPPLRMTTEAQGEKPFKVKAKKEKRPRFVMPALAEQPLDVLLDQIRCHSESLHLFKNEPRCLARSERVIAQAMAEITRRMQNVR